MRERSPTPKPSWTRREPAARGSDRQTRRDGTRGDARRCSDGARRVRAGRRGRGMGWTSAARSTRTRERARVCRRDDVEYSTTVLVALFYYRMERTAPIFSKVHSAMATVEDFDVMLSRTRTVNGSAVSSMERMVDVISSGSRGPTRSRTSRASDFIATNGGRGKIARSMRAIDAAQFPALDATTPYIAGPMTPGNSSNVSGNENSLRNAPSSSSHLYVCKPIFASDSCARPHVKSIHPGSYASCKLRFGRDASQGATPATTAGCVRELHGFTSTPRRRSASQSDDDDDDDGDDDAAVVNIRSRMVSIAVRMDDRDDDDAASAAPRRCTIIIATAGIPLAVAPFAPNAPREPAHDVAHDAFAPHVGARATSSRAKRRCMEMID